MGHHFFGLLNRMKFIKRWSLMRNLNAENLVEHSYEVAILAQHLALLRRVRFSVSADGSKRICPDPKEVLAKALLHDATEIVTGDLPTPVKYHDPQLRESFALLEAKAALHLLSMLPEDLRPYYSNLLQETSVHTPEEEAVHELIKAADKLSAWLKCLQEVQQGNSEFVPAKESIYTALEQMALPEVDCFLVEFAPAYGLPLDALKESSADDKL